MLSTAPPSLPPLSTAHLRLSRTTASPLFPIPLQPPTFPHPSLTTLLPPLTLIAPITDLLPRLRAAGRRISSLASPGQRLRGGKQSRRSASLASATPVYIRWRKTKPPVSIHAADLYPLPPRRWSACAPPLSASARRKTKPPVTIHAVGLHPLPLRRRSASVPQILPCYKFSGCRSVPQIVTSDARLIDLLYAIDPASATIVESPLQRAAIIGTSDIVQSTAHCAGPSR